MLSPRTEPSHLRCLAAAFLVIAAGGADARELWTSGDGEKSVSLKTSLKSSFLLSHAPDDASLFPERDIAATLGRLRLTLDARPRAWMNAEAAYEHRARSVSEGAGSGTGAGLLSAQVDAPYRISQVDEPIVEVGDTFSYRHELDRALVALHFEGCELMVGRQAIGLGRGTIFSAVDVFAPFSPAEVDREWRRGVDAVKVDVPIADTYSFGVVAAFGEDWDRSAVLARLRGYAGDFDAELIVGKRAEDDMYGAVVSAGIGGAEFHCELAVFRTPEEWEDAGLFGDDKWVGKGVFGGSYNFDVGAGLTAVAEYHYCGFGVGDIRDAATKLEEEEYQSRYLRGDMQMLSQHALALKASYTFADTWGTSMTWMQSLTDGSGFLAPSLTWDFAENVTVILSTSLPYGATPSGGTLRSEYGAMPTSVFIQMSLYY